MYIAVKYLSMFWQVLFEDKKTLLELHFYSAVLPMLKHHILLFQSKDPKVHKLHDEQERLVSWLTARGGICQGRKMLLLNQVAQPEIDH